MSNKINELTRNIQDRVREIAYLMWESAGRQHGMAMEYWLAAEKDVLNTMQAAAGAMTRGYQEEAREKAAEAETEAEETAAAPKKPAAKTTARRASTAGRKAKTGT